MILWETCPILNSKGFYVYEPDPIFEDKFASETKAFENLV